MSWALMVFGVLLFTGCNLLAWRQHGRDQPARPAPIDTETKETSDMSTDTDTDTNTRVDQPIPPCPPWCEEIPGHTWDWLNDDGSAGRGHATKTPTLAGIGFESFSAYISQEERSLNGVTGRGSVGIYVDAGNGINLSAVEAETIATWLLKLVTKLLEIEAAESQLTP